MEQPAALHLAVRDDVFGQGLRGRDVEARQAHAQTDWEKREKQGKSHF